MFVRVYPKWLALQNSLYTFVTDPFFEVFITLCILLNTLALAVVYYNMPDDFATMLDRANYFFTAVFATEAVLKIVAFSKLYFQNGWNIFDLIVVLSSLVDIILSNTINGNTIGLSVVRLFRLLRVFKLAQNWKTMRILLTIILSTLSSLAYLTIVLLIFLYMIAIIGMQLFSQSYVPSNFDNQPVRWGFQDFLHSMLLSFRVMCAEWIQPLQECVEVCSLLCILVFLTNSLVVNMIMLNLFLALLLNAFNIDNLRGANDLDTPKDERLQRRLRWVLKRWRPVQTWLHRLLCGQASNVIAPAASAFAQMRLTCKHAPNSPAGANKKSSDAEDESLADANVADEEVASLGASGTADLRRRNTTPRHGLRRSPSIVINTVNSAAAGRAAVVEQTLVAFHVDREEFSRFPTDPSSPRKTVTITEKEKQNLQDLLKDERSGSLGSISSEFNTLVDCCCGCVYTRFQLVRTFTNSEFGLHWIDFRLKMLSVVEHRVFEATILMLIFISSATMCFEDTYIDERPDWQRVLTICNYVFTGCFIMEMLVKMIAFGCKKYFTTFWTLLDFVVVSISVTGILVQLLGISNASTIRSLRTLRALRPLRAVSRWQGMRLVVMALVHAIPSIVDVMLVCFVVWLIFSIMGVQFFAGKFQQCVDMTGARLPATVTPNYNSCVYSNLSWINPSVNFDNVLRGFVALYEIATFEGWIELMANAVDAPSNLLDQPSFENSMPYYLYFVVFVIVGRLFMLNLIVGVIIDNFNSLQRKYQGNYLDMFMTDSQKTFYHTVRKLGTKKPQKTIKRPSNKVLAFFYDCSISITFELIIVFVILLNMMFMALEHYQQSQFFTDLLRCSNIVFASIFAAEAAFKLIGLRWYYFRNAWNVFDFIVVVVSLVDVILSNTSMPEANNEPLWSNRLITPSLLRVVRVFRIGRVFRLVKVLQGLRKCIFALLISLPALVNIGALLFLVIFIYAIVGMTLFGNVARNGALNEVTNFETFGNTMVLLFRLSTVAGWNDILDALSVQPPNCNDTFRPLSNGTFIADWNGDCGLPTVACLYFITYLFLSFFIIVNTYIAIILENFNEAHHQDQAGVTEDDIEMFYATWEKFDPQATQFMAYRQVGEFLARLDDPLRVPKPNEIALVIFDLPIYADDKVHCLDILMALIKRTLGEIEDSTDYRALRANLEQRLTKIFPSRAKNPIISTTMQRKKIEVAAVTLQRAWRRHKMQRNLMSITSLGRQQIALENGLQQQEAQFGHDDGGRGLLAGVLHSARDLLRCLRPSRPVSQAASAAANRRTKRNLPDHNEAV